MRRGSIQQGAGIFDGLSGAASAAADRAKAEAQAAALKAKEEAAQAIADAAKAAETEAALAAVGSKVALTNAQKAALRTSIGSAGGVGAAVSGVTSGFQRYVSNPLKAAGNYLLENKLKVAIILAVIAAIAVAIWYFTRPTPKSTEQTTQTTANTLASAAAAAPATTTTKKEGFQVVPAGPVDPDVATLVNLQPLTISQAAYVGPPQGGRFDPEAAITQALRSGFRAFVLQIDYLDTVKGTGFAATGAPTLVYRGADGALLSSNTGSIKDTADLLARVGYRPDMPNYEQPLVLYLHVLRTPSAIRAPEAYLEFLSGIAKELAPLAPSHLGLTPLGSFHRQKREAELLTIPIKNLQGKTIILSNVDTTMFRTPVRAGTTRYAPAEDLDYWVNMRVYEEGVAGEGVERAVLVRLAGVLGLQGPAADAFALKGRRRFVIAMPDPLKNPTAEEVSRAINDLGVNMLPLDIFTQDPAATKGLMQEYTAMSFRPKPAALRSVA